MMFQALGPCMLMRLMRLDREAPTDWLLYGPSDEEVIEEEKAPPRLLAAE